VIIAIGRATAKEGCHDRLVSVAAEVLRATRDDEGCASYTFAVDVNDPRVVVSVEVWGDRAALDAHIGHDHTQEFLANVGDLVEGTPSMSFFTADSFDFTTEETTA
jgi:quinol monooxygenase YgiN